MQRETAVTFKPLGFIGRGDDAAPVFVFSLFDPENRKKKDLQAGLMRLPDHFRQLIVGKSVEIAVRLPSGINLGGMDIFLVPGDHQRHMIGADRPDFLQIVGIRIVGVLGVKPQDDPFLIRFERKREESEAEDEKNYCSFTDESGTGRIPSSERSCLALLLPVFSHVS